MTVSFDAGDEMYLSGHRSMPLGRCLQCEQHMSFTCFASSLAADCQAASKATQSGQDEPTLSETAVATPTG